MALVETGRPELAVNAGGVERDGAATLVTSGVTTSGEFRCAECGYGVVVRRVLPACPMCRGLAWKRR